MMSRNKTEKKEEFISGVFHRLLDVSHATWPQPGIKMSLLFLIHLLNPWSPISPCEVELFHFSVRCEFLSHCSFLYLTLQQYHKWLCLHTECDNYCLFIMRNILIYQSFMYVRAPHIKWPHLGQTFMRWLDLNLYICVCLNYGVTILFYFFHQGETLFARTKLSATVWDSVILQPDWLPLTRSPHL